jgi:glutamate formiminotransferase / 5-formyltetrahydrofolate cyclo-ligase
LSKIIQCIPNFSEGHRPEVVSEIAEAIKSGGATVINSSLDPDHNRSVITFIGDPSAILAGILSGVRKAVGLIDLTTHAGEHPRIGAVDVIPLVPIRDVTMDECVELSREVGRVIADELRIPVYFYEKSATVGHRKNLAHVRKGGFEGLRNRVLEGDQAPDVGPNMAHPTAGATAVGARGPLIAFNVNLRSKDFALARHIASEIRRIRGEGGGMPGVKAIAVKLKSKGIVQVSTNITQPDKITMFEVYDFVRHMAAEAGVKVERSELIGVVRLDAVADAAAESLQLADFDETRVLDHWIEPD